MKIKKFQWIGFLCLFATFFGCKSLQVSNKAENASTPKNYQTISDSTNVAELKWKEYFSDSILIALIDTALKNNQELNIITQEVAIAKNEVRAKKGEYLPFLGANGLAGFDKVGRYTNTGASEANIPIAPGKVTPDPLSDLRFGVTASWELDIWKKLRNTKESAFNKYVSTIEGRNFAITNLIAEIANSYYELLALHTQLDIVKQNIEIQKNALNFIILEKTATRVTELAVRRFEAEVFHTRSLEFEILQKIIETENSINFLVGRFPQPINRSKEDFNTIALKPIFSGVPSQLLQNRADIRQAEQQLKASKLDVKVAKAHFYPSVNIGSGLGFQAFNPSYLLRTPESLIYSLAGDIAGPLINRNGIKAAYYSANAKQIQAAFEYEKTILKAFIEVSNQLSKIQNLEKSFDLKSKQVKALNESITISTNLFKSARADYMEVLLTQRDALISKFELVETQKERMHAMVNVYKVLGGGWK